MKLKRIAIYVKKQFEVIKCETGRLRGAAHNHCNLKYKVDKQRYKLPIVFHNLRGYDAHLIFQKVKQEHGKINVIPNNSERYIPFDIGRLKFLDSMQFLSCGLNKLAEQLSVDQFIIIIIIITSLLIYNYLLMYLRMLGKCHWKHMLDLFIIIACLIYPGTRCSSIQV